MKNISVALTKPQIKDRIKTVTRRKNWWKNKNGKPLLRVGDVLRPVDRVMGFKAGEKPQHIGEYYLQVVSIRREKLSEITQEDCVLEGSPEMTPTDFISLYISANGGTPDQMTTRIEFEYTLGWQLYEYRFKGLTSSGDTWDWIVARSRAEADRFHLSHTGMSQSHQGEAIVTIMVGKALDSNFLIDTNDTEPDDQDEHMFDEKGDPMWCEDDYCRGCKIIESMREVIMTPRTHPDIIATSEH